MANDEPPAASQSSAKERSSAAEEARAARDRIAAATLIYFAIVFGAGLALGPMRVAWIEPWLGPTFAVLLEAPILVFFMSVGAQLAPHWAGVKGGWASYLAIGVLALVLQGIADLAVGFGLRGMTLADQAHYFTTPPGWIYAAALIVFALMPLIMHARFGPPGAVRSPRKNFAQVTTTPFVLAMKRHANEISCVRRGDRARSRAGRRPRLGRDRPRMGERRRGPASA
ncbi:MAG TPA: hypothetical protein VG983_01700 [Caulobacterales bacterium]|nr:hypothetical protein [Caulobacterales bacterium]